MELATKHYVDEALNGAELTDTTYTFTSGTTGNFTVTPEGGTAQTVSIGKPATAGTADKATAANLTTTQNAIAKYSNTTGTFANSGVTIDSNNNISTSGKLTATELKGYVTVGQLSGSTLGTKATAEGGYTTASGNYSHAEGYSTIAAGGQSHAEGWNAWAKGNYSHAEGIGVRQRNVILTGAQNATTYTITNSTELSDLAVNDYIKVNSIIAKITAIDTTNLTLTVDQTCSPNGALPSNCYVYKCGFADGTASHTEGCATITINAYTHAEGYVTKASGTYGAHAEGNQTIASGKASHTEGSYTIASGEASHAGGGYNIAEGNYSMAGGKGNIIKGNYSFAYGMATDINSTTLTLKSSNVTPFQRNVYVLSSGTSSTGVIWTCPDGSYTNCYFEQVDNPENNGILLNYYMFYYPANPSNTLSNAVQFTQPFIYGDDNGSYTFNIYILPTNALNFIYGNETFAYGKGLKTFYPVTSLFGKYNTLTTDNSYIEIVGNGTSNSARSDARRLDQNGNEELAGNLLPMVNNSKDLGTYNKAWKDIYVYNKIQFPNNNTIEYLADSNSIFQISTTQNDLYLLSMRNISQTASFNINLTSVASNINLTVPGNTDTTGKISFCRVNDNAEDIEIGFIDKGGLQLNEGNDVIFKSKSEDTSSSDPGGIHWFKSNGTTRKATIKVPNIDDVSHSYPAPIYENTYHSTTGYRHLGLTNAFFAKADGTSQTRNSVAGYDISLYNNIRGSGFCNDHPVQPGDIISVYFPTATTTSILALHVGSRPFGSTSSQTTTYQSLRMYKGAMSAIGAITAGKTITFIAMWAIKSADGGIGSQTPALCLYKIAEC